MRLKFTNIISTYVHRFLCFHLKLIFIFHNNFDCIKMKFLIKDFFSKYDQILSFIQIWSHLLKKSLMENLIFCAVFVNCKTLYIPRTFRVIFWKNTKMIALMWLHIQLYRINTHI